MKTYIGGVSDRELDDQERETNIAVKATVAEREAKAKLISQHELLSSQIEALQPPIDVTPLQGEYDLLTEKVTSSVASTKGKEIQIETLSSQVDALEKEMGNITTSLALGYTPGDTECSKMITIIGQAISLSPGDTDSMQTRASTMRSEADKLLAKAREYEESWEAIEYNRRLEDVLECPSCNSKLRHTHSHGGTLVVATGSLDPKEVKHNISKMDIDRTYRQAESMNEQRSALMKSISQYEDLMRNNPFLRDKDLNVMRENLHSLMRARKQVDTLKVQLDTLSKDTRDYLSRSEYDSLIKQ